MELIVLGVGVAVLVAAVLFAYRRGGRAEVARREADTARLRLCRIVEFEYDDGRTRVRHSVCHGDVSEERGKRIRGPGLVGVREIGAHEV